MRILALLAIAALLTPPARADEPKPGAPALADRARILRTELRRGPAADLAPYLAPDVHPALRQQAIRALGRIGDRAGAPEWLVKLLGGGADAIAALEAAGLNAAPSLEGSVVGHLSAKDPAEQAAAIEALGWIASASVGGYGAPQGSSDIAVRVAAKAASLLHSKHVQVQEAALTALALAGQEGYLERVLAYCQPMQEAEIQDAAAFAVWFLARARRTAAKAENPDWAGEPRAAAALLGWAESDLAERRLDAVRPLGILAPLALDPAGPLGARIAALLDDPDARVVEELIARVLTTRKGAAIDAWLARALGHADAKVRQAAIEALGEHGSAEAVAALKAHAEKEADDRLRVALGAALVKAGRADDIGLLPVPLKPSQDPDVLAERVVRIFATSKDAKLLDGLAAKARTQADKPLRLLLVLGALEEHKSEVVSGLVGDCLKHADPYVRAAAVGLAGKQLLKEHLAALDGVLAAATGRADRDVRQAVIEAWAEFAKAEGTEAETRDTLKRRLAEAARTDPAFTARASARKALKELNIDGGPAEDPLQPNDWQGLPRPKAPVLGLDLTQGGPWLDEAEILELADRLAAEKPEFVIQNEVDGAPGAFRLRLDPSEAPVHAVSFLLAATSGVYDGTVWHRVVPSFVIQGGDPHGDGSGDAGWSLPDEITRARFVRGALGMPKGEVRDTGGCQLFVMHSPYRPLDGRYTCYGSVVDGMDTVDRIRVGDRVTGVRMLLR